MGLGQLYISLETSVLCEDWIYRGNLQKIFYSFYVSVGVDKKEKVLPSRE